jgi:hypothetical protein
MTIKPVVHVHLIEVSARMAGVKCCSVDCNITYANSSISDLA